MAKSKEAKEPKDCQPTFEESLEKLGQIVVDLEEGEIGLADALARYEDGVKLLRQCYTLLESAERRIELLSGVGPGGEAITEPFAGLGNSAAGQ